MLPKILPTIILLIAPLAACNLNSNPPEEHTGVIRDSARVVSVDPSLGTAVLDVHGRQVHAYWQTEIVMAQGGAIANPDTTGTKLPVGQYRQPIVRTQTFAAAPGDTIDFVGMWTGDQIFLRTISVQTP